MNMLAIDEKKCNQDGICVAECPHGAMEMEMEEET